MVLLDERERRRREYFLGITSFTSLYFIVTYPVDVLSPRAFWSKGLSFSARVQTHLCRRVTATYFDRRVEPALDPKLLVPYGH